LYIKVINTNINSEPVKKVENYLQSLLLKKLPRLTIDLPLTKTMQNAKNRNFETIVIAVQHKSKLILFLKMISLKWIAWLFVILVQAVIHFGLVGRKKRMENREKKDEQPKSEEAGAVVLKNGNETYGEGTKGTTGLPVVDRDMGSNAAQSPSMSALRQDQYGYHDDYIDNSIDEETSSPSTHYKPLHETKENEILETFRSQESDKDFYSCRKSTDSVGTAETFAEPVDEDSDYDDDEQWKYELQHFEDEHESVETIHMLTVKMRNHDRFGGDTDPSSNLTIDSRDCDETALCCRPECHASKAPGSGTLVLPVINCL
jgi:hypothetical protein